MIRGTMKMKKKTDSSNLDLKKSAFMIQCTNKLYSYKRFVGLKASGNPQIVYEGSDNYLKAIHGFEDKKSAEEFLVKIITREGVDLESISPADIIDYALITNSTEFRIVEYSIQDDKLEVINSYLFNSPNKYISECDD